MIIQYIYCEFDGRDSNNHCNIIFFFFCFHELIERFIIQRYSPCWSRLFPNVYHMRSFLKSFHNKNAVCVDNILYLFRVLSRVISCGCVLGSFLNSYVDGQKSDSKIKNKKFATFYNCYEAPNSILLSRCIRVKCNPSNAFELLIFIFE